MVKVKIIGTHITSRKKRMTLIFFIIAGIVWNLPISYWLIGLLCFILEPKR